MLWKIDELVILAAAFAIFLGVIELGFRLGRRGADRSDDQNLIYLGVIQAGLLGLLGLLLGFSFAMAVSRFDARKAVVVEGANAIGTAYLRAQMLPAPQQDEIKKLLRDYVTARLALYDAGIDPTRLAAATAGTSRIEGLLWTSARAAVAQDTRAVPSGLFVQSLNDVFDTKERRLAALNNRVPEPVIVLLFTVSAVTLGFLSYACGLRRNRRQGANTVFALLIVVVLTVILDLDRPTRGFIRVIPESMLRLKASLDEESK